MLLNCPFCGLTEVKIYATDQKCRDVTKPARNFFICTNCGTIYPNPRLSFLEVFISDSQNTSGNSSYADPTRPFSKTDLFYFSNHQFVVRLLKKYKKKFNLKKALDIGTSDGRFCFLLNTLGITAYGLEPQLECVESAKKHDLNVFQGLFPEGIPTELTNQQYDLITLNEVIYYFEDIAASFNKITDLLSENGLIFIQVHTGESYYYNHGASLFSRYGDQIQSVPTVSCLKHWLDKSNFKILEILPYPDEYFSILTGVAPKKGRMIQRLFNLVYGNFFQNQETLLSRVDRIIIIAGK